MCKQPQCWHELRQHDPTAANDRQEYMHISIRTIHRFVLFSSLSKAHFTCSLEYYLLPLKLNEHKCLIMRRDSIDI